MLASPADVFGTSAKFALDQALSDFVLHRSAACLTMHQVPRG